MAFGTEVSVWCVATYGHKVGKRWVVERGQNVLGDSMMEVSAVAEMTAEPGETLLKVEYMGTFEDYTAFNPEGSAPGMAVGAVDIEKDTGIVLTPKQIQGQ